MKPITMTLRKTEGQLDDLWFAKFKSALGILPNGDYEVKVSKKREKRSINQNNMMWMWFTYIGNDLGYEAQDIHDFFCSHFSTHRVNIGGTDSILPIKTSQLNTEQMTEFLNKVQQWCVEERGYTLPTPDDMMWSYFEEQLIKYL